MRTFISFVGSNDPIGRDLKNGPIVVTMRYLCHTGRKPDRTVLFWVPNKAIPNRPPPPDMEAACLATHDSLVEWVSHESIFPERLDVNAAVEDGILEAVLKWLDQNLADVDEEFHIGVTSGTPAMRGVCTFLVGAGLISNGFLWYRPDPVHILGEDDASVEDQVVPVSIGHWAESRRIHIAAGMMRAMAFEEASQLLQQIPDHLMTRKRKQRVELWKAVLSGYSLWDRAEYRSAREKLEAACALSSFSEMRSPVQNAIKMQVEAVRRLSRDNNNPITSIAFLFDLFASLSRRRASHQFANVATRTRRILEGIVRYAVSQHRLKDAFEPGTDVMQAEFIREDAKTVLAARGGFGSLLGPAIRHFETYGNAFMRSRDLDANTNTPEFWFTSDNLEEIERLYHSVAETLNTSVELHGFLKPDADQVNELINVAQRCLAVAYSGNINNGVLGSADFLMGANTLISLANIFEKWV